MTARAGRAEWVAQIAPITAITLFGVTMAMSYPLFGLVLERAGTSGTMIGVNTTAAAVAMVAGAPILPPILRRYGLGPLMIVAALALAATMLAIPLVELVLDLASSSASPGRSCSSPRSTGSSLPRPRAAAAGSSRSTRSRSRLASLSARRFSG